MQLDASGHHPFDARGQLVGHIVIHYTPKLTSSDCHSGPGVYRVQGILLTSGMLTSVLYPIASWFLCVTTHLMESTRLTS